MKQRPFLVLWTCAIIATVAAFVVDLGLRGRTVDLGYRLGRAHAEQARLREVKRVLSLESASLEAPQRVETVARTLLGMAPPPPERVITLRARAAVGATGPNGERAAEETSDPAPAASDAPAPAAPAASAGATANGGTR